jgi:hypothetical protein
VTAALAAARDKVGHRTIHVAAGTYDAAHGERFPLIVRGDLGIVGAGTNATFIQGTGTHDSAAGFGAVTEPMSATIVIGDHGAPTSLSALTLASGHPPVAGEHGVVCDRGNRSGQWGGGETPTTVLDDVVVGPGYDVGVYAVTSFIPAPSGCNIALEHSRITQDHFGVWVRGGDEGLHVGLTAAVTADDTHFVGNHSSLWAGGFGIVAWDSAAWVHVRDSRFEDSDNGVLVVNHFDNGERVLNFRDLPVQHTDVILERNSFRFLTHAGVWLQRDAHVARLADNQFLLDGIGLLLDGDRNPGELPQIHARGNSFTGNDVAILLRADNPLPQVVDFGRPDDPGGNLIRCNAAAPGAATTGHDVVLEIGDPLGLRLSFAGDIWDHAPPTMAPATGAANGVDVVYDGTRPPAIDLSGATAEVGCNDRPP